MACVCAERAPEHVPTRAGQALPQGFIASPPDAAILHSNPQEEARGGHKHRIHSAQLRGADCGGRSATGARMLLRAEPQPQRGQHAPSHEGNPC
jgi:hypothetical protein